MSSNINTISQQKAKFISTQQQKIKSQHIKNVTAAGKITERLNRLLNCDNYDYSNKGWTNNSEAQSHVRDSGLLHIRLLLDLRGGNLLGRNLRVHHLCGAAPVHDKLLCTPLYVGLP